MDRMRKFARLLWCVVMHDWVECLRVERIWCKQCDKIL